MFSLQKYVIIVAYTTNMTLEKCFITIIEILRYYIIFFIIKYIRIDKKLISILILAFSKNYVFL